MARGEPAAVTVSDAPSPALQRVGGQHLRVFFSSLGRLWRNPLGSLLSALVIGITLALPASLKLAVDNLSQLGVSWERAVEASLFLKDTVSEDAGRRLAQELAKRQDLSQVQYVSREQSLAEFRQRSGFGAALEILDENPLPAVIVVAPKSTQGPQQIAALMQQLSQRPEVDQARIDQEWLQRLNGILTLAQRAVRLVALMLGLAVIVIVGNTIRLDIESQRDEILVMKLLGASDGFIQRPFLYTGFWHGLAGAVLALLMLFGGWLALLGPASDLATLYGSPFRLQPPASETLLALVIAGIALGAAGAWWTVRRHLSRIEPG